jgi:hypothetical protein
MFRELDASKIIKTLDTLAARVDERFPGAGLARVCLELASIARETTKRAEAIAAANLPIRFASVLLMGVVVTAAIWLGRQIQIQETTKELFGILQGIDAAVNLIVVSGVGLLFLWSLELRMKRQRTLRSLHELRSIMHVIDMHQLTKDPSLIALGGVATSSSPNRSLTPFELTRYLDYCSEMLSLTAKVAALYAQSLPDPVVVDAVSDLERLTANLSQKIWQKIALVEQSARTSHVEIGSAVMPTTDKAL